MKVRIGIDVGGTFTDAALVNSETYELMAFTKIPTTHNHPQGVAAGIVQVLTKIMEENNISPDEVEFISHGTTQATNALLEGDVSKVGVIGLGKGAEGMKVKVDTNLGDIELAKDKFLRTESIFLDTSHINENQIHNAINTHKDSGCEVIVAASAFSVDDPSQEISVLKCAQEDNIGATATHEISKLYGLRIRTRTAAVNASILPRMIQTANMTQKSVKEVGINTPLMIMRCDGGVMDVNEVKKRPILTMLSGPAAGVAGALMYEKVSNGIFLEVGGTSTDISAIKNGKVMVEYAQIGDNKTYLTSLDVRTVGIAGGSMVRIDSKGIKDAGPRSAHIARLPYVVFTPPEKIIDPKVVTFSPCDGDPDDYLAIECADGARYAITVSCAANLLGYVKEEDYSHGYSESVRIALQAMGDMCGKSPETLAKEIMDAAAAKNAPVVRQLMKDYDLSPDQVVLVGGGGGCSAIVPQLAESMQLRTRNCKNASVISTIGVALAMVRDSVERTVLNPTEEDVLTIRQEAFDAAIRQGANPDTIEIQVEVDPTTNTLRATAVGTTELRTKDMTKALPTTEEICRIAAEAVGVNDSKIQVVLQNGNFYCIHTEKSTKKLFGLLKQKNPISIVADKEGVIRIQQNGGHFYRFSGSNIMDSMRTAVEQHTIFGDANMVAPDVYLFIGGRICDYSGVIEIDQIMTLAHADLQGVNPDAEIFALIIRKKD